MSSYIYRNSADLAWADVAAIGGDFFGMSDDNMYHIPSNISTVVDLLEDKGVSWAPYQENMPADEIYGYKCMPNCSLPSPGAKAKAPGCQVPLTHVLRRCHQLDNGSFDGLIILQNKVQHII